jgi:23S rRNA pseudouridine1911/1915/1917 synthase
LLELRLETGRTHQIRVHLAAIGRPIVNDPRYGRRREPGLEEGRVFLHAEVLGFDHPSTGERIVVSSALPEDLAAILG